MSYKCEYCKRSRQAKNDCCPGCGQTEIEEIQQRREYEFFHKGYFVKVVENRLEQTNEYFFFRGRDLIDRIRIGLRDWMMLIEPLDEGTDCFYLIWDMFEKSQKDKFGVVKTYEKDPKYKRVEVRLVPWGYEVCNAISKINGRNGIPPHVHGEEPNYVTQMEPSGSVDSMKFREQIHIQPLHQLANWHG